MYRGVFLDLDGTTLNSKREISEKTIDTLRRLNKKGFFIVIATGRSSSSVFPYFDQLALEFDYSHHSTSFAVCFNGACGFEIEKDESPKCLFFDGIEEDSSRKLLEFTESHDLLAQYYNGTTGEVQAFPKTDQHYKYLHWYSSLTGIQQIIRHHEDSIKLSPAAKILVMTSETEKFMNQCIVQFSNNNNNQNNTIIEDNNNNNSNSKAVFPFHMINGAPHDFVEFLEPGVFKGEGCRKLSKFMGVDMSEMIAFGDGENDKEMLAMAGLGIAMKNAVDICKDSADLVIEWSNNEDGVALQLERLEAEGKLIFSGEHPVAVSSSTITA